MPRAHEIAGSNPAVLTDIAVGPVLVRVGGCYPPRRRFDSCRRSFVPLAEWQRCQASNLARRVRFPQGTLIDRGSANGRLPGFEPVMQVQVLLPEPW